MSMTIKISVCLSVLSLMIVSSVVVCLCLSVPPSCLSVRSVYLSTIHFVIGESVTDDMQSMMNETQQHENMTVPEGQTVILHCMVASFPHATYYWSFNGSIVQGDTTKQFTTIRRSLVIAEVGYSADGEYICTASNGTVYIQNIVYLKTLGKQYVLLVVRI